jgi:type I restriction enzyme S subunit
MIVNAAYGAIIQHIEPGHILDLPVPRFNEVVEEEIHRYVQTAADLRVKSQNGIASATRDLFESAGLSELMNLHWYRQPRETGFVVNGVSASSLRAVNYSARAGSIIGTLRSIPHRTIGDISQSGQLATGPRFKRIDTDPGNGIMLLGQRQGFWSRPTGRWISPRHTPKDVLVEDETVMIAEHGLVGENALIGRAILVSGGWTKYAYTQDFLRLKSGIDDFPGAYIFAFLRSEPAFRALRSMLVGTGPQEINIRMFENLPVPECTTADRQRIAEAVRQAYRWRDQADHMEDRAQDLLNMAVHDAVGADLQQDRSLVHRSEEPDGTGDG